MDSKPEEKKQAVLQLAAFDKKHNFAGNGADNENEHENSQIEENIEYYCLHSNRIRPNLNYYLLHNRLKRNPLPDITFKAKMNELYDGSDSRGSSRLLHITSNDDLFTFYENAIHRHTHKTSTGRKESEAGMKSAQYWLLSKGDDNGKNATILQMLNYVKGENMKMLQELCILCKDYIKRLEILTLRSHINLGILLSNLPKLEHLRLTYGVRNAGLTFEMDMAGMNIDDCHIMAESLANPFLCKNMTKLQLSENRIDDQMIQVLISGLIKNKYITDLNLSHNRIAAMGCKSLSAYLISASSLRYLDLSDNNIGPDGGKYISYSLKNELCHLVGLNLRLNRIRDEGVKAIARSLEENKTLKKLNLSGNHITHEGLEAIVSSIIPQSAVDELDISSNNFVEASFYLLEGCYEILTDEG